MAAFQSPPQTVKKLASALKMKNAGGGGVPTTTKVSMSSRSAVTWHSNFTINKVVASVNSGGVRQKEKAQ